MSSKKSTKWSSSSSLSKILSRISRTLSISSKKSQQSLKTNPKKIKPIESVIKNVHFIPQSAPVIRRHPPQPISKFLFLENSKKETHSNALVYRNMHATGDIEEDDDDDDCSQYSLRANLSLFNISLDNLNSQSFEFYQQRSRQGHHPLDDIFHSTKIEDY